MPHRVICLLGLDDDSGSGTLPAVGGPRRHHARASATATPAASSGPSCSTPCWPPSERLLLFSTGNDIRTNASLPPVVSLAELLELVDGLVRLPDGHAAAEGERGHHRRPTRGRRGPSGPCVPGGLGLPELPVELRPRRPRGGRRPTGPGPRCPARSSTSRCRLRASVRPRGRSRSSRSIELITACLNAPELLLRHRLGHLAAPRRRGARRRHPPRAGGARDVEDHRPAARRCASPATRPPSSRREEAWEVVERRRGAVPPLAFGVRRARRGAPTGGGVARGAPARARRHRPRSPARSRSTPWSSCPMGPVGSRAPWAACASTWSSGSPPRGCGPRTTCGRGCGPRRSPRPGPTSPWEVVTVGPRRRQQDRQGRGEGPPRPDARPRRRARGAGRSSTTCGAGPSATSSRSSPRPRSSSGAAVRRRPVEGARPWSNTYQGGDGTDRWVSMALGADFDGVLALPLRPDEPVRPAPRRPPPLVERAALGHVRGHHGHGPAATRIRRGGGVVTAAGLPEFSITGPLPTGLTVLEASAGTGKTYSLAGLVTRYVAEAAWRRRSCAWCRSPRPPPPSCGAASGRSWSRRPAPPRDRREERRRRSSTSCSPIPSSGSSGSSASSTPWPSSTPPPSPPSTASAPGSSPPAPVPGVDVTFTG